MAKSRILGPDGQPLDLQVLQQPVAEATVTGIRSVWGYTPIAAGLTPARLASILTEATQDWARDYLTLAEEMEERDWHYSSVLGTRKRAVSGLPVTVEAASDSAHDKKLADAVRELLRAPDFGEMIDESLDGLGKAYSVNEIIWDRSGKEWNPTYTWRDPRFFRFDETQSKLLLMTDENIMGEPLAPYKFIVHRPRLKSGIPIRGGLARLAASAYMIKSYTITDWMAFAEVFGMPLRLGRYDPGTSQEDINTLISAVANIGTDAAAILPKNMQIDFEQLGKTSDGGAAVFENLANWIDRQVSKAVLGQTLTTDAQSTGLGSNTASVHDEVRTDIQISDARQLRNTLNRDLVKPYIDLNYGPQESYPRIKIDVVEPEDIDKLTQSIARLMPYGLRVDQSEIRGKLGLSDPGDKAEVLNPAATKATAPAEPTATARNRAETPHHDHDHDHADDDIDGIVDGALDDWQPLVRPLVDQVRDLAAQADNEEDFLAGLAGLMQQANPDDLVRSLATATFQARGLGDATDQPDAP